MTNGRRRNRGIFCIEGDWWNDLRRPSTVRPLLDLLGRLDPFPPHIYRNVGTREEFDFALEKWTQRRYADYPILYLASHGDRETVLIGDRRKKNGHVTLDHLADTLEGRCDGRIICFGACKTLQCDSSRIKEFLKRTRALAVCGYRDDVDWVQSAAFELLMLKAMLEPELTLRGAREAHREVLRLARQLARQLRFRMVIRDAR